MRRLLLLLLALPLPMHARTAPHPPRFSYPENRPFRLCQITDIQDAHPMIEEEVAFLQRVLAQEKPDLAILTGDNSDTFGNKVAFPQVARRIVGLFQEAHTPFAVTFGNHDSEKHGEIFLTRDEQYDLFRQLGGPLFVDFDVPRLSGSGSGAITLCQDDTPAFLIVIMDSGDYPPSGGYDGCRSDQLQWYVENASHLPCLWFQHIIPWDIYENGVLVPVEPTEEARPRICQPVPAEPDEPGAFFSEPLGLHLKPLPPGAEWLGEIQAYAIPVPGMQWVPALGKYMRTPQGSVWAPMTGKFYTLAQSPLVTGTLAEAPCPPRKEVYTDPDHTWRGKTLYQWWRTQGNLRGAYFGHDHMNTFDATDAQGIRMGFGKAATLHSYNDGNPGVRFFDLMPDGTYHTWTVTLH
ncbi:MAG: metallophosphoesterase family protein [Oligosphaeraceae bacterium]